MRGFKAPDRNQITLMPPSIDEWLPEKHLARFVVEIVDQVDLDHIYRKYGTSGSTPYDPGMLLSLLFYGYATGVYSSRKIEEATYDSVAFRFISGDLHPDHDTIANFRKRFIKQIEPLFVKILVIASEMGFVKIGHVNIDGTKIQANASKHSAMSYEYLEKLEKQFAQEVERLLQLAEEADTDSQNELDIPAEIQRREDRLAKLAEAKKVIEERAKMRYEQEKAEYDQKMKAREEKAKETGKKPKGKEPTPPQEGPNPQDQYNFTDPESRIMKTNNGFNQCYNAQAAVTDNMLIVGAYANAHCNDKEEFISTIDTIPQEQLGKVDTGAADTGYFSEKNVNEAIERGVEPYIAVGRQAHNQWLDQQLSKESDDSPGKSPKEQMGQKLKTDIGKAIYRMRKMTVEPVFGIIKEIMGFRRFSLRGEEAANGEWLLVCASFNIKRLFNLANG